MATILLSVDVQEEAKSGAEPNVVLLRERRSLGSDWLGSTSPLRVSGRAYWGVLGNDAQRSSARRNTSCGVDEMEKQPMMLESRNTKEERADDDGPSTRRPERGSSPRGEGVRASGRWVASTDPVSHYGVEEAGCGVRGVVRYPGRRGEARVERPDSTADTQLLEKTLDGCTIQDPATDGSAVGTGRGRSCLLARRGASRDTPLPLRPLFVPSPPLGTAAKGSSPMLAVLALQVPEGRRAVARADNRWRIRLHPPPQFYPSSMKRLHPGKRSLAQPEPTREARGAACYTVERR
ncbi:hypothetical protein B0H11DRAFT_2222707 [Mycena galericulata]|nr:hypothetical protein B0H11DRAFT_2222707 [Mycena galericulata]